MGLLVSAIVQIIVGIAEKALPTFVALWRERQAKLAADAKLVADQQKIGDAMKAAQAELPPSK